MEPFVSRSPVPRAGTFFETSVGMVVSRNRLLASLGDGLMGVVRTLEYGHVQLEKLPTDHRCLLFAISFLS